MAAPSFAVVGTARATINVTISNKIIQLFSEGLYSSPNKAIEELVSNSFDAGATNVHVILSPDLLREDATIAVLDDGTGMTEEGFRKHWIIGSSQKRNSAASTPKGRRQIGKFGIGKLATFVLAEQLTHISKVGKKYYSTSMDYSQVPSGEEDGIAPVRGMPLPFRVLTERQARQALAPWLSGRKAGYKALQLFGSKAPLSWTVAIMSSLKPMAQQLQRGRLRWVLGNSMPLGDDFKLYLDGDRVESSKLRIPKHGTYVVGKELTDLPRPGPDNLTATVETSAPKEGLHRYGLSHPTLGRVTGFVEIYKREIDTESQYERNHGFFVYVRGRLINLEDPGFGIDRNKLRHGTFSHIRVVLHMDGLDAELRSSRETLREGPVFSVARNIAHAIFNFARGVLEREQAKETPEARLGERLDSTPRGLTRRPLAQLVEDVIKGKYEAEYISVPAKLTPDDASSLLDRLRGDVDQTDRLVRTLILAELGPQQGIALLDVSSGRLTINTLHPFVAHFLDEFSDNRRNLPLELLATSEIFYEAHLYAQGIEPETIGELLKTRDALLRHLASTVGSRNALGVAQDLLDSATDKAKLEQAVVAAFNSMGFHAVPIGGKGKPDGKATAILSARRGKDQGYSVSLEAKSKEELNKRVANQGVRVSTVVRHRDSHGCHHALVVGPDFATTQGHNSALAKELSAEAEKTDGTITLIRIQDLARLVRLVPLRRIGLDRLRELFTNCMLDVEVTKWVDALQKETPQTPPFKEILEQIHYEQQKQPDTPVEFAALRVSLRERRDVEVLPDDLVQICRALARMIPGWVEVTTRSVGIYQRPDLILKHLSSSLRLYPEAELGDLAALDLD